MGGHSFLSFPSLCNIEYACSRPDLRNFSPVPFSCQDFTAAEDVACLRARICVSLYICCAQLWRDAHSEVAQNTQMNAVLECEKVWVAICQNLYFSVIYYRSQAPFLSF